MEGAVQRRPGGLSELLAAEAEHRPGAGAMAAVSRAADADHDIHRALGKHGGRLPGDAGRSAQY
ncbi:hypothetical protein D3C86_2157200 [compost metagenome]